MIYSLPDFIAAYWYYLLGVAVICAVCSYKSEKFLGNLKKAIIFLTLALAAVAGYEIVTGKSIFTLPGSVERELSKGPEDPETGRRYYRSYEERFGEKPPD